MTDSFEGLSKELLVANWTQAEEDLGLAVELIQVLTPALIKVLEFSSDGDGPRYAEEGGFELIRNLASTALAEGDRIGQKIIDGIRERHDS